MPVTTKNHDIFEHLTSDSRHDARYERMRRKAKAFLASLVKDELEPMMDAMYEEAEDEIPPDIAEGIFNIDRNYHIYRVLHILMSEVIDEVVKDGEG